MTPEEAREVAGKACVRAHAKMLDIIEPKDGRYVLVFEWRNAAQVGGSPFNRGGDVFAVSLPYPLYTTESEVEREQVLKDTEDIWRDAIRDKIAASK